MASVAQAWVRPGDRVAVISPSGPSDAEDIARGVAWLSSRYVIRDDARRSARTGYLAGNDETRAAALLEALEDPGIRAVVATRGGYGAMRVLEHRGPALRRALEHDPKVLLGYSDITALHALWRRVGVPSVHGPMVATIGRGAMREADRDEAFALLEGGRPTPWPALEVWHDGEAEGLATGGNLAVLASLAGTPYAMPFDGAIVFLEDVGERPYRVDRMLTTLRLAGAFRGARGIVWGDFVDCVAGPDGVEVRTVLRERVADFGIPVFAGAPFGHGPGQRSFALGGRVRMQRGGTVVFGD